MHVDMGVQLAPESHKHHSYIMTAACTKLDGLASVQFRVI